MKNLGFKKRARAQIVLIALGLVCLSLSQNCSKVGFTEMPSVNASASLPDTDTDTDTDTDSDTIPESKALVYGADAQDRKLLAEKIAGYAPPGMSEIFNNWRRLSGPKIFANGSAVVPEPAYSFCFTGLDANGNWLPGIHPATGKTINPGSATECASSVTLAASSWSYLNSPGRIHNATNANPFNGFISTLKFDRYVHEAVLTSSHGDDDSIGLVIAVAAAPGGVIHTLTATRTQGGLAPKKGWGIVHRRNGTVVGVFSDSSVGGTHCSNTCPPEGDGGDGKGWNGRMTKVRIEREENKIVAYASPWGTSEDSLILSAGSRIEIDLADPVHSLEIFKGAQAYGYGIQSQIGAEFRAISFSALNDAEYVYDLENDLVYRQNGMGGYTLQPQLRAFTHLGYPRVVGNIETQKEFRLNEDYTYTLLP